ncbi:MAG: M48 family metallopeptidase, partial [Terriglobia bacterium]
ARGRRYSAKTVVVTQTLKPRPSGEKGWGRWIAFMKAALKTHAVVVVVLACLLAVPVMVYGIRELRFKPGFDLYTPAQDVEEGRQAAAQVEKTTPMLRDPETLRYINDLGKKLASFAPNNLPVYAWQFHVVNTKDINAFALPGGFIFVNRGTIAVAENEAQLAGVMAHEIGHVVMRHGTHQASVKSLAQLPLAIFGAATGSGGAMGILRAGLAFGLNSAFLKNSRDMEGQADEVGTYILYHAGYDPHAMSQFFEILQQKYPQQTVQFFSDHPNPGNRIANVNQEIPLLGAARRGTTDTPEFERIRKRIDSLPPPPPAKKQ